MKRELLVGCGNSRTKRIKHADIESDWHNLTTLDIDPSTKCDVVHDLDVLPYPFADNEFDEVHAYECLEHCGRQGDWRFFFAQWSEFWRILKPDGLFCATVPSFDSPWAWGDPGHTRLITPECLIFLDQDQYAQVGRTSLTDYRPWWNGSFETVTYQQGEHQFGFVLKAVKPSE